MISTARTVSEQKVASLNSITAKRELCFKKLTHWNETRILLQTHPSIQNAEKGEQLHASTRLLRVQATSSTWDPVKEM